MQLKLYCCEKAHSSFYICKFFTTCNGDTSPNSIISEKALLEISLKGRIPLNPSDSILTTTFILTSRLMQSN